MTTPTDDKDERSDGGQRLLSAVERLLAPPDEIWEVGKKALREALDELPGRPSTARQVAAGRLVERYAKRTAWSGGLSALPGLIPGVGTVAAVLGGGVADMTACLKYETELVMALAVCFGHDVTDEDVRRRCLLLAGHATYQDAAGRSAARDYLEVGKTTIFDYSTRQLGKALSTLFLHLSVVAATKGVTKAVPILGAVVGYAANKALTRRVGREAITALEAYELGDEHTRRNPFR